MINKAIITLTNISRKIRLTKFSQKKEKKNRLTILVRVYYLWAPKSHQSSHTFNVRLFYGNFGRLFYHYTNFPLFQAIIKYQLCPHGTAYYHQLTMTQNFLCIFFLDILFHFCFALPSSSYIHHSQFLVLFAIQSLLERF